MNMFNPIFLFWDFIKRVSFGIKTNLIWLCTLAVLIWMCWWLYQRFNTIPIYKNEITIYEFKSEDINPKLWLNFNINFGIYKHSQVPKLNTLMYQQNDISKETIAPIFTNSIYSQANLKINETGLGSIEKGIECHKYIELCNTLADCVDTFNLNNAVYALDITYKQTYPKGVRVGLPKAQTIDNKNSYIRLFDAIVGEDSETEQKAIAGRLIKVESGQTSQHSGDMFFNGIAYGNGISNSFFSIFNLYDISQAYIILKYSGNANIDHIRFNFGSAVQCTGINTEIADIYMDHVIINDSNFLNANKYSRTAPMNNFEIKFHVSAKDTQNLHTMRIFVLSTIFSLLFTILIDCMVKIVKIKTHRFVPRMRDNTNGKIWSVYDCWFGDYSQFMCHRTYETKELCEFHIAECNKKYKKHFKASLSLRKKTFVSTQ